MHFMPLQTWNECTGLFHSNNDLQIYIENSPPMKLPGLQTMTPSVALQHSCDVISFLQWHDMHAMLLRFSSCIPVLILKSQRLKFSQTNHFSQINKFFVIYVNKIFQNIMDLFF